MENFQILDADSSQQEAILAAKNGRNFVMQGPPGTGKSQTIANIIAEFLALGKKVLFVSEKKAALEVVKKRIDEKGLGDYCLDLHNHNSNKKSLLQDLSKSLNTTKNANDEFPYFSKFDRIKKQLNDYVSSLHTKLTLLNQTPQKIHGRLGRLDSVPDLLFDIKDVEKIDQNKLNEMEDFLGLFEKMKDLVKQKDSHLWKGTLITESSFDTESRISEKFETLSNLLREINASLSELINFQNILGNKSLSMIDRLTEYKMDLSQYLGHKKVKSL
nr:AAA domain-containing protein [Bacillus sp. FJAT-49736]